MSTPQEDLLYLLLDSASTPLARGKLESPISGQTLQLLVLDGKENEIAGHDVIQLVGMGSGNLAMQCQLVHQRGARILLNRVAMLDSEFRRNLRVPVKFKTFIFPIDGAWKGRRYAQSVDLSCGGIAFYADAGLKNREHIEIVIPITSKPLVLRCEILRQQPLRNDRAFYAAKFVDICDDEETIVREAVFRVQLHNRPRCPLSEDNSAEVKR